MVTNNATVPAVGSTTYTGTRLYFGSSAFPNGSIARGSYSLSRFKEVRAEYYDASGRKHTEYYSHPRVEIKFSIRERDVAEQKVVAPFFASDDAEITYWDDALCSYQKTTFKHETIEWAHLNTASGIQYAETEIVLFSK